jgi:hypothetical protein
VPVTVRRTESDTPLRVSVTDDTPGGSAEDLRASVWLAAVTAALQRGEPLRGTRIGVDISGDVGGPSAGGVLCLAIMTALDEKAFPSDFAMTGTILPDGTVGLVGGVAAKLKAAAAKGIKRACIPAFQRFEEQEDGELVDLFRVGERDGLTVYPVEHISEAYAVLHGQPKPVQIVGMERDICALPKDLEDVLIAQWKKHGADAYAQIKSLDKETIDAFPMRLLSDPRTPFHSGRLITAQARAEANAAMLRLWPEFDDYFTQAMKKHAPVILEAPTKQNAADFGSALKMIINVHASNYDKMSAGVTNKPWYKIGYAPATNTLTDSAAQLEMPLEDATVAALYTIIHLSLLLPEGVDQQVRMITETDTGWLAPDGNKKQVQEALEVLSSTAVGEQTKAFVEISKMVAIGSGAKREQVDYELSRYACYLIVQNGDPRKQVIALGQTYFHGKHGTDRQPVPHFADRGEIAVG